MYVAVSLTCKYKLAELNFAPQVFKRLLKTNDNGSITMEDDILRSFCIRNGKLEEENANEIIGAAAKAACTDLMGTFLKPYAILMLKLLTCLINIAQIGHGCGEKSEAGWRLYWAKETRSKD